MLQSNILDSQDMSVPEHIEQIESLFAELKDMKDKQSNQHENPIT